MLKSSCDTCHLSPLACTCFLPASGHCQSVSVRWQLPLCTATSFICTMLILYRSRTGSSTLGAEPPRRKRESVKPTVACPTTTRAPQRTCLPRTVVPLASNLLSMHFTALNQPLLPNTAHGSPLFPLFLRLFTAILTRIVCIVRAGHRLAGVLSFLPSG